MAIRTDEKMIVNNRMAQIGFSFKVKPRYPRVAVFQCSCGKRTISIVNTILTGKSRSCGCLQIEIARKQFTGNQFSVKHGMSNSPEYRSWSAMVGRCTNKNHTSWENYGGRGITVCSRWEHSFEAFLEDMGSRPKGTTIDRIDNSLGYSPENCRWATGEEQSNNKRSNHLVEIDGVSRTVTEWSRISGVSKVTIRCRLANGRWSNKEAVFSAPDRKRKQRRKK